MNFTAIDFETAVGHASACAVGIVVVENGVVVDEFCQLIQPPNNTYTVHTTRVHGLRAADTKHAPLFPDIFPEIYKRVHGRTVVAHNESFDRAVLRKTAALYDIECADLCLETKWQCTKRLYQQQGFKPCDLATLSAQHGITLNHHEALSDARACAALYLRTLQAA